MDIIFQLVGERPIVNKDRFIKSGIDRSKRVLQFAKDGEFVAEHFSGIYAAKSCKGEDSAIYSCCVGKTKSAYGFIWRYKENFVFDESYSEYKIEKYTRRDYHEKICQIDLNGKLVREWDGCPNIEKYCNIQGENVRLCCNKEYGRKTCGGYIWMYANDYYENGVNLQDYEKLTNGKPVNQYDLNENYITSYESAREAERNTGISYKLISACCNKNKKTTHGYIWKFAILN